MIVVLADSNALRSPDLQAFLEASTEHVIALSDVTLTEMLKKNAVTTARQSLRIASRFPEQTVVLRRTHEFLDGQVSCEADARGMFDDEATLDLRDLCLGLHEEPARPTLVQRLAQAELDAGQLHVLLAEQVAHMEPSLVDALKDFRREEIEQLRTGRGVSEVTRQKIFELLKQTVRNFILQNQQPDRREPLRLVEAHRLFAFRYSLCTVIYYLDWVRKGRQTGLALERRVNDVVDLQLAAIGTFFNGVASADQRLQLVSKTARRLLRDWGAYVGDDVRHALNRDATTDKSSQG